MRTLNLRFLAILLAIAAAVGGAMHLVHGIQIQRNASSLLDRARRAEAGNDWVKAGQSLREYLNLRRDDGATWEWYARIVDQQQSDRRRLDRVFMVHEQALRHDPGNLKLERRCADLALEMGRYSDAQRHLKNLDDQIPRDSRDQPAAAEQVALAELEDLEGQCELGQTRFEEAERFFSKALENDPGRVSCYDRLARLRRIELRRIEAADRTVNEMVARNPKAGRAYVYRWRYRREFSPPPDASDLQKALELAPVDPEVLLTAAIASEEKANAAAARAYFEKGFQLDPKNLALALGLAGLDTREGHRDRAETVLRKASKTNPSAALVFSLAETLILQDKIDGKDQAGDYITRLRNAGLGDTYVRFLEARILVQRKKWGEAIPKIEMARAVLGSDQKLTTQLNLMLADCYGQLGAEEQRLDALRLAAEGDQGSGAARLELARARAQSGNLDEALVILLPLSERQPELMLEIVRLLIQKTLRQPGGRRDWGEVEQRLVQAEKARPQDVEVLTLLRVEMLAGQNRHEEARSLLAAMQVRDPHKVAYRLALARITQKLGDGTLARKILDGAEKDLGPSRDIQLARLDLWGLAGGSEAKAAVAKLAETRKQFPAADQRAFLDQLARTQMRLRELPLARESWRELATLQPKNMQVLLELFDLAMEAADHADASDLVTRIRALEGEQGTFWRFAQAVYLIDQARRGGNGRSNATGTRLDVIRLLASEIAERRPDWWGAALLQAEIAGFDARPEVAIAAYQRAIELGNSEPAIIRHVIGLLSDGRRFADIDRLVTRLQDRGIAADDLAVATAFDAIRKKDYDRGLALARQVIPASSTRYSDHLALGRILMSSRKVEEAGKEFRQAVDLAPSVPETWRTWIEYLARTNRPQAAREAAAAAEKALSPTGSTLSLGQCAWSAGEVGKAEALFREAIKDRPHDAATLRLVANFFIDQNRPDHAGPLVAELLKPESRASQADLAWARRTKMMLGFANLVTPEQVEQNLKLVEHDLESDPNDPDALRMRAVLLSMRNSRRKESIQALESMDRANEIAPRERFLLATLYYAERAWPKCRAAMRRILEDGSRQPRHLVFYVGLMIRLGELNEAESWLQTLKPLLPADQGAVPLELEAMILKAKKQDREIAVLIRRHLEQNPAQAGAAAFLFERYGFVKEAEQAYRTDLARNPDKPASVLVLVEFLTRQDRPGEALELCEKAMSTRHREAAVLASVTTCIAKSVTEAHVKKVEGWLRELLRQKPDDLNCNLRLGRLCTLRGNYGESEAIYRRVLRADRDNIEALNNLAWQLALRGEDCDEALKLVDRAIDIAGQRPALVGTRAVVLMQLSQGDKAVEMLRDAVRSDPEKPIHYFHLARAFRMTNEPAEARKAFERSKALGLREETVDPLERGVYLTLQRDSARQ